MPKNKGYSMFNIIDKIAVYTIIKRNKNNTKYYSGPSCEEVHNDKDVTITKKQDYDFSASFTINYTLHDRSGNKHVFTVNPDQQSLFDELFIKNMYYKMLEYCDKKNLLQTNTILR